MSNLGKPGTRKRPEATVDGKLILEVRVYDGTLADAATALSRYPSTFELLSSGEVEILSVELAEEQ